MHQGSKSRNNNLSALYQWTSELSTSNCSGDPGASWVLSLTWLDVVPDDSHMIVTVRPCVLVPEANDVTQFVHHDAKLVTVLAYGDSLGPVATTTHIGTTPNKD